MTVFIIGSIRVCPGAASTPVLQLLRGNSSEPKLSVCVCDLNTLIKRLLRRRPATVHRAHGGLIAFPRWG